MRTWWNPSKYPDLIKKYLAEKEKGSQITQREFCKREKISYTNFSVHMSEYKFGPQPKHVDEDVEAEFVGPQAWTKMLNKAINVA